jgi:hypothetical protein
MDAVRGDTPPRTRDVVAMTVTADLADPAYQAYLLLRNALTIALILAGADKFLNAMIDWVQYLAPAIPRAIGLPPEIFLRGVGVVEIALGILVACVPRRAAYALVARAARLTARRRSRSLRSTSRRRAGPAPV